MKKTKMMILAAFVIALASAFTTKHSPKTLQNAREALTGTHMPCDITTANCGTIGGICTDATGNITFYPLNPPTCVTPLQKP
jgi:hypothetical protein